MSKVYISGKITGLNLRQYQAKFERAARRLKTMGYIPINPAAKGEIIGYKWEDYMKDDIKLLCDCDYIYQLENWEESEGAKFEYEVAKALKKPVLKVMLG